MQNCDKPALRTAYFHVKMHSKSFLQEKGICAAVEIIIVPKIRSIKIHTGKFLQIEKKYTDMKYSPSQ